VGGVRYSYRDFAMYDFSSRFMVDSKYRTRQIISLAVRIIHYTLYIYIITIYILETLQYIEFLFFLSFFIINIIKQYKK